MIRVSLIFLLFLISSCSKEKSTLKKLNGVWEITNARIEDGEGFSFYTSSVSGTMKIDSKEKVCTALLAFSYENLSELAYIIYDTLEYNSSAFSLNNSEELEVFPSGFGETSDKFRILDLTKDYLVIEYYHYSGYKLKRFTLRKK